jgi:hypothetical protein
MEAWKTNTSDKALNKFNAFKNEHGNEGFKTLELANTYAKLKCEWWGSNLVVLPIEEKNGLFYPRFNVFD